MDEWGRLRETFIRIESVRGEISKRWLWKGTCRYKERTPRQLGIAWDAFLPICFFIFIVQSHFNVYCNYNQALVSLPLFLITSSIAQASGITIKIVYGTTLDFQSQLSPLHKNSSLSISALTPNQHCKFKKGSLVDSWSSPSQPNTSPVHCASPKS